MNTPCWPATGAAVRVAAVLGSCCTSLLLLSAVLSIGDGQRAAACQPAQV